MTETTPSQTIVNTPQKIAPNVPDIKTSKKSYRKYLKIAVVVAFVLILIPLCYAGILIFIFSRTPESPCCIPQPCLSAPNSTGCQDCLEEGFDGEICSKCDILYQKMTGWSEEDFKKLSKEERDFFESVCKEPNTFFPTATPSLNSQTKTFTSKTGFSFQYPEQLTISETTVRSESPIVPNPGEYQQLHTELGDGMYLLSIVYKNSTNPVDMEIYGGAAGEFVSRGTVNFLREPLEKFELVWEDGNNGYYYAKGNTITRGNLTFAISLITIDNKWESSVPAEIVQEVDMILQSFTFDTVSGL